jgi:hypothetical protein
MTSTPFHHIRATNATAVNNHLLTQHAILEQLYKLTVHHLLVSGITIEVLSAR